MAHKQFAVFDGDSHVVEPPELWTKYLEPEYRTLGKSALWREQGKLGSYLKVNGKVFRDTMNSKIPRHAIWKPGMTWEQVGELDPDVHHAVSAGASNPEARLKDMDAMGVDQALLYPTWFAEGFHLVEDPDIAYPLARAYNDWIADFCKRAPDRLFAASMIPLQNIDYAIEELRRTAKIPCFRAAFIRPMFLEGHYFTHPIYDPLWAELEKLGTTVAVHPAAGLWNPEWTSHGPFFEKVKGRLNLRAFTVAGGGGPAAGGGSDITFGFTASPPMGHPIAPIISHWLDNHMFVASTLIGFTVMERYPNMKMVVAHGKASWMEEVLEKMEASTRTIPLLHHYPVRTDTEEMWEEGKIMLGFDAEERLIQKQPEQFKEKIVWGSRYPHHDTTSAWEAIEKLTQANVAQSTIARMLGGNAAAQFGVPLVQKVGA
ncbi:MAG: amidohydrolase family protein [Candidatus Binatus sp.]|uniref:amidohydrolase family protein n=1 Tax=Candidatus Binatus sp. TaxID=2811406 RepID=UPI0027253643|nr:amidohydrolase family protein [Candidatus Binatus sp.]MDO8434608.1 amidohydrolase family protein [Candidatus Binatus sp.]